MKLHSTHHAQFVEDTQSQELELTLQNPIQSNDIFQKNKIEITIYRFIYII